MRRLTAGISSEKCVIRRFRRSANVVVCPYTNLYTWFWYVLSPTRKATNYSDRSFWCSCILFIIIVGGILVLFIYITRLASNEIFQPPNKIHREVGRAKGLPAPVYIYRGADKFLARPGRQRTTATEDFDVHISYLQS